ncbi:MAG: hypothetical protein JSU07_05960 [Bacteroidetes bacterium]|nr:hypothetical protein [Bacteroidota bacterium]
MYNKRHTHIYIILFILFSFYSNAQNKIKNKKKAHTSFLKKEKINAVVTPTVPSNSEKVIQIKHASSISFDKTKGDQKVLSGNVICEHEGTILNCDTAWIYDGDKKMRAYGHVLITKGDSIKVTGDTLIYDANLKLATLTHSVICTEKDMTLTTDFLTFQTDSSIANYYNGGKIVNKQNTLTSKNGHYYSNRKTLAFHYDAELINPEYKIKSDTLKYNTSNKTAYFLGPSIIISKLDYIYCENGWYDTNNDKARFSKNALLVTKQQRLTGDSLYYDRNLKYGKAYNNVRLIDTAQKSIIYGNFVEYFQKNSEALVTNKALYARIVDKDTVFIAGDTLFHKSIDSTHRILNAFHHVRIYKKDMQAVADSAVLSTKDSLVQLFKNPILWSKQSQATAKKIKLFLGNKTINGFKLEGNAFLIQLADSIDSIPKYNQLSGRSIEAIIRKDTVKKVLVIGNANAYYFAKNKTKFLGLNKSNSDNITLWFSNNEIERVTFFPKTTGDVTPIKDVDVEVAKLKGFSWQYNKRPKGRFDLHPLIEPLKKQKTKI